MTAATEPTPAADPARRPGPVADAILRRLSRLVLSVFFRRIEVVGQSQMPETGPLIVVANHYSGLVDGALVTACLPRIPRLLASISVWDNWPLIPLLRLGGVIPVYRRMDPGTRPEQNKASFASAIDLLAEGGVLALFPEGISHNESSVQPMKTGAARIALGAEAERGPLGVRILPVALVFDSKARFRSRVLVEVGAPIDVSPHLEGFRNANRAVSMAAVRELTERIRDGILSVMPSYASWDEARALGRAADMWGQREPTLPVKTPLAEASARRRAFIEGYGWMRDRYPERVETIRTALTDYNRALAMAGLRDEQVGAAYPPVSVAGFALRSLLAVLVRLPLAAVGVVLNYVPYWVSRLAAHGQALDKRSTLSIFVGIVAFPLCWMIEAGVAAAMISGWAALAILIAGPVCGRIALTALDKTLRLMHEARAWLLLRTRRNLAAVLVAQRKSILEQLAEVVALYRSESTGPERTPPA